MRPMSTAGEVWRRPGVRRVVASIVMVVIVVAVAGLPIYVRPRTDQLRPADAILILGGPGPERYQFGLGLAAAGWAPDVVLSNPYGNQDEWLSDLCATPQKDFRLYCFVPSPPTTRGEAQQFRALADQHHWNTIIAVTFAPHVTRARFILERCFGGQVLMVESPADISIPEWAFEYAYQTAGFAKAVVQPGC